MHTLRQSQTLPVSRKVLWEFVSVPQNLNQITPPKMAFKIIGDPPESAYEGLLLEYKVRIPVLGWTTWLTEIKYVTEGYSFMDEQRIGPYKLWLHTHTLEDVDGGTKMTDEIRYALPFGLLGEFAHAIFVKRTLKQIFDYRREKLDELFATK